MFNENIKLTVALLTLLSMSTGIALPNLREQVQKKPKKESRYMPHQGPQEMARRRRQHASLAFR